MMSLPLPERTKRFFERISTDGEAALADLRDVYADDIHFVSPAVDQRGIDTFEKLWRRAFRYYKLFKFGEIEVIGDEHVFTMTYTMSVRFAVGPVFKLDLATDFHGRDGKVFYCRDYFDMVGVLLSPVPPVAWAYRKIFSLIVV